MALPFSDGVVELISELTQAATAAQVRSSLLANDNAIVFAQRAVEAHDRPEATSQPHQYLAVCEFECENEMCDRSVCGTSGGVEVASAVTDCPHAADAKAGEDGTNADRPMSASLRVVVVATTNLPSLLCETVDRNRGDGVSRVVEYGYRAEDDRHGDEAWASRRRKGDRLRPLSCVILTRRTIQGSKNEINGSRNNISSKNQNSSNETDSSSGATVNANAVAVASPGTHGHILTMRDLLVQSIDLTQPLHILQTLLQNVYDPLLYCRSNSTNISSSGKSSSHHHSLASPSTLHPDSTSYGVLGSSSGHTDQLVRTQVQDLLCSIESLQHVLPPVRLHQYIPDELLQICQQHASYDMNQLLAVVRERQYSKSDVRQMLQIRNRCKSVLPLDNLLAGKMDRSKRGDGNETSSTARTVAEGGDGIDPNDGCGVSQWATRWCVQERIYYWKDVLSWAQRTLRQLQSREWRLTHIVLDTNVETSYAAEYIAYVQTLRDYIKYLEAIPEKHLLTVHEHQFIQLVDDLFTATRRASSYPLRLTLELLDGLVNEMVDCWVRFMTGKTILIEVDASYLEHTVWDGQLTAKTAPDTRSPAQHLQTDELTEHSKNGDDQNRSRNDADSVHSNALRSRFGQSDANHVRARQHGPNDALYRRDELLSALHLLRDARRALQYIQQQYTQCVRELSTMAGELAPNDNSSGNSSIATGVPARPPPPPLSVSLLSSSSAARAAAERAAPGAHPRVAATQMRVLAVRDWLERHFMLLHQLHTLTVSVTPSLPPTVHNATGKVGAAATVHGRTPANNSNNNRNDNSSNNTVATMCITGATAIDAPKAEDGSDVKGANQNTEQCVSQRSHTAVAEQTDGFVSPKRTTTPSLSTTPDASIYSDNSNISNDSRYNMAEQIRHLMLTLHEAYTRCARRIDCPAGRLWCTSGRRSLPYGSSNISSYNNDNCDRANRNDHAMTAPASAFHAAMGEYDMWVARVEQQLTQLVRHLLSSEATMRQASATMSATNAYHRIHNNNNNNSADRSTNDWLADEESFHAIDCSDGGGGDAIHSMLFIIFVHFRHIWLPAVQRVVRRYEGALAETVNHQVQIVEEKSLSPQSARAAVSFAVTRYHVSPVVGHVLWSCQLLRELRQCTIRHDYVHERGWHKLLSLQTVEQLWRLDETLADYLGIALSELVTESLAAGSEVAGCAYALAYLTLVFPRPSKRDIGTMGSTASAMDDDGARNNDNGCTYMEDDEAVGYEKSIVIAQQLVRAAGTIVAHAAMDRLRLFNVSRTAERRGGFTLRTRNLFTTLQHRLRASVRLWCEHAHAMIARCCNSRSVTSGSHLPPDSSTTAIGKSSYTVHGSDSNNNTTASLVVHGSLLRIRRRHGGSSRDAEKVHAMYSASTHGTQSAHSTDVSPSEDATASSDSSDTDLHTDVFNVKAATRTGYTLEVNFPWSVVTLAHDERVLISAGVLPRHGAKASMDSLSAAATPHGAAYSTGSDRTHPMRSVPSLEISGIRHFLRLNEPRLWWARCLDDLLRLYHSTVAGEDVMLALLAAEEYHRVNTLLCECGTQLVWHSDGATVLHFIEAVEQSVHALVHAAAQVRVRSEHIHAGIASLMVHCRDENGGGRSRARRRKGQKPCHPESIGPRVRQLQAMARGLSVRCLNAHVWIRRTQGALLDAALRRQAVWLLHAWSQDFASMLHNSRFVALEAESAMFHLRPLRVALRVGRRGVRLESEVNVWRRHWLRELARPFRWVLDTPMLYDVEAHKPTSSYDTITSDDNNNNNNNNDEEDAYVSHTDCGVRSTCAGERHYYPAEGYTYLLERLPARALAEPLAAMERSFATAQAVQASWQRSATLLLRMELSHVQQRLGTNLRRWQRCVLLVQRLSRRCLAHAQLHHFCGGVVVLATEAQWELSRRVEEVQSYLRHQMRHALHRVVQESCADWTRRRALVSQLRVSESVRDAETLLCAAPQWQAEMCANDVRMEEMAAAEATLHTMDMISGDAAVHDSLYSSKNNSGHTVGALHDTRVASSLDKKEAVLSSECTTVSMARATQKAYQTLLEQSLLALQNRLPELRRTNASAVSDVHEQTAALTRQLAQLQEIIGQESGLLDAEALGALVRQMELTSPAATEEPAKNTMAAEHDMTSTDTSTSTSRSATGGSAAAAAASAMQFTDAGVTTPAYESAATVLAALQSLHQRASALSQRAHEVSVVRTALQRFCYDPTLQSTMNTRTDHLVSSCCSSSSGRCAVNKPDYDKEDAGESNDVEAQVQAQLHGITDTTAGLQHTWQPLSEAAVTVHRLGSQSFFTLQPAQFYDSLAALSTHLTQKLSSGLSRPDNTSLNSSAPFSTPSSLSSLPAVRLLQSRLNSLQHVRRWVQELRGEAMTPLSRARRHWELLQQRLPQPSWCLDRLTVRQVLWDGLIDSSSSSPARTIAVVQDVLETARGEWRMTVQLQRISDYWDSCLLPLSHYRHRVGLVKDGEQLLEQLADDTVTVSGMRGSRFFAASPLVAAVAALEQRLDQLRVVLELLMEVQRRWVYLDGVWGSSERTSAASSSGGDRDANNVSRSWRSSSNDNYKEMRAQLPRETAQFERVSAELLPLLPQPRVSGELPCVRAQDLLLANPEMPEVLSRLSNQLTAVQRALTSFLDSQRARFPRFYFVGDEDLLEVIASGNDPLQMGRHVRKMFAAVAAWVIVTSACKNNQANGTTIVCEKTSSRADSKERNNIENANDAHGSVAPSLPAPSLLCSSVGGFRSAEGEEVRYALSDCVTFAGRPVHDWLCESEAAMRQTLRRHTVQAHRELWAAQSEGASVNWLTSSSFATQVICLAVQLWWVQIQEAALDAAKDCDARSCAEQTQPSHSGDMVHHGRHKRRDDASGSHGVVRVMESLLEQLASRVVSGDVAAPALRHRCEQVITLAVYQRDVSRELARVAPVLGCQDYAWARVMRVYVQSPTQDNAKSNDGASLHTSSVIRSTTRNSSNSMSRSDARMNMHATTGHYASNEANAGTVGTAVVECCMADARVVHGFEYTGCQERLVQTPLTDRCYLTLMQALHSRLGGAPVGPAGTGKTESVKALGAQLGRHVLVFNCDDTFDYLAVCRILRGLCQVGAWGCFDEFNRLEERILSALSQQMQMIQEALRGRCGSVELNAQQRVPLHPNMAIFVTMNPHYAGRCHLPSNLKQLFRTVTMAVPDRETIAEVMLFAQGFYTAEALSRKVVPLFDLCASQFSRQTHYDFGLRALKSVLVAAGEQKRLARQNAPDPMVAPSRQCHTVPGQRRDEDRLERGKTDDEGTDNKPVPAAVTRRADVEAALLFESVWMNVSPRLVARDAAMFYPMLRDFFPTVSMMSCAAGTAALRQAVDEVCAGCGLAASAQWVDKVMQLHHTLHRRHGVILVGPSGSGKTSAWRVLMLALARLHQRRQNNTCSQHPAPRASHAPRHRVVRCANGMYEIHAHVLEPKVLTKAELFGSLDLTTREWRDGVFSALLRRVVEMEQPGSSYGDEVPARERAEATPSVPVDPAGRAAFAAAAAAATSSHPDAHANGHTPTVSTTGMSDKCDEDGLLDSGSYADTKVGGSDDRRPRGNGPDEAPPAAVAREHWIIFDGDVDPAWAENLNSVLDDNKILTLPNGERLALPGSVRLLFEVQDLTYATPATVSRCGMLCFSSHTLPVSSILHMAQHRLSRTPMTDGRGVQHRPLLLDSSASDSSSSSRSSEEWGSAVRFLNQLPRTGELPASSSSSSSSSDTRPVPNACGCPPRYRLRLSRGKLTNHITVSSQPQRCDALNRPVHDVTEERGASEPTSPTTDQTRGERVPEDTPLAAAARIQSLVLASWAADLAAGGVVARVLHVMRHAASLSDSSVASRPIASCAALPKEPQPSSAGQATVWSRESAMALAHHYRDAWVMPFMVLQTLQSVLSLLWDGMWNIFRSEQHRQRQGGGEGAMGDGDVVATARRVLLQSLFWGVAAAMDGRHRRVLAHHLVHEPGWTGVDWTAPRVGGEVHSILDVEVDYATGNWALIRRRVDADRPHDGGTERRIAAAAGGREEDAHTGDGAHDGGYGAVGTRTARANCLPDNPVRRRAISRHGDVRGEEEGIGESVIRTVDTCRHADLLTAWLGAGRSVILTGPPGSGKTMSVMAVLRTLPEYTVVALNFSSGTGVSVVWRALEQHCTLHLTPTGYEMTPAATNRLLLFCDEINLPAADVYGTSAVLQLLRQIIEWNGCYRVHDGVWVRTPRVAVVGACNPPQDLGRVPLSARLRRWTPLLWVDFPSDESLHTIYRVYATRLWEGERFVYPASRATNEAATEAARGATATRQDTRSAELTPTATGDALSASSSSSSTSTAIPSTRHAVSFTAGAAEAHRWTRAAVRVYAAVRQSFTVAQQPHYVYSPRELSRWLRAMQAAMATWERAQDAPHDTETDAGGIDVVTLVRLAMHEGVRVFADRLVTAAERRWTVALIRRSFADEYAELPSHVCGARRDGAAAAAAAPHPIVSHPDDALLFSALISARYVECTRAQLRRHLEERLAAHAAETDDAGGGSDDDRDAVTDPPSSVPPSPVAAIPSSSAHPSRLVVVDAVIDHMVRIDRVLRQPLGHLLLVGSSGVGKSALAQRVAWMQGYTPYWLRVHRAYDLGHFVEDLRALLLRCGVTRERVCFFLDESDLMQASFVEYMNALLASGEVPGLFEGESWTLLMQRVREAVTQNSGSNTGNPTSNNNNNNNNNHNCGDYVDVTREDELYRWFVRNCQRYLHVIFAVNPDSGDLTGRTLTSPALVNRCTIDWMGDWDDATLRRLAEARIESVLTAKPGKPVKQTPSDSTAYRGGNKHRGEGNSDADRRGAVARGHDRWSASAATLAPKDSDDGEEVAARVASALCDIHLDTVAVATAQRHGTRCYGGHTDCRSRSADSRCDRRSKDTGSPNGSVVGTVITPRHFIEYLRQFNARLLHHRADTAAQLAHREHGLRTLQHTARAVATQQEQLRRSNVRLAQSSQQAQQMLDDIVHESDRAARDGYTAAQLRQQLQQTEQHVHAEQSAVTRELAAAEPALHAAAAALNSIRPEYLNEMRRYATPPIAVRAVLAAVLAVLGNERAVEDWEVIKSAIRREDFLAEVKAFRPAAMTELARQRVESVIGERALTLEAAQRASKAAGPLLQWVWAQVNYARVHEHVAPMRARIEQLHTTAQETTESLHRAEVAIAQSAKAVEELKARYQVATEHQANLRQRVTVIRAQCHRAQTTLTQLCAEEGRWKAEARGLARRAGTRAAAAAAVLAGAVVAYWGFFDEHVRHEVLLPRWRERLMQHGLVQERASRQRGSNRNDPSHTDPCHGAMDESHSGAPTSLTGGDAESSGNRDNGLHDSCSSCAEDTDSGDEDALSFALRGVEAASEGEQLVWEQCYGADIVDEAVYRENAAILTRTTRYPFLLDPTGMALGFVQRRCAAANVRLVVVSMTQPGYLKQVETAMRFGYAVVVQDAEQMDPALVPLMGQEFRHKGGGAGGQTGSCGGAGGRVIRLGPYDEVDVATHFQLILHTREAPYSRSSRSRSSSRHASGAGGQNRPHSDASPGLPWRLHGRVCVINFSPTRASLRGRCLRVIVRHERPDVEGRRREVVRVQADSRARLSALEQQLLTTLADAEDDAEETGADGDETVGAADADEDAIEVNGEGSDGAVGEEKHDDTRREAGDGNPQEETTQQRAKGADANGPTNAASIAQTRNRKSAGRITCSLLDNDRLIDTLTRLTTEARARRRELAESAAAMAVVEAVERDYGPAATAAAALFTAVQHFAVLNVLYTRVDVNFMVRIVRDALHAVGKPLDRTSMVCENVCTTSQAALEEKQHHHQPSRTPSPPRDLDVHSLTWCMTAEQRVRATLHHLFALTHRRVVRGMFRADHLPLALRLAQLRSEVPIPTPAEAAIAPDEWAMLMRLTDTTARDEATSAVTVHRDEDAATGATRDDMPSTLPPAQELPAVLTESGVLNGMSAAGRAAVRAVLELPALAAVARSFYAEGAVHRNSGGHQRLSSPWLTVLQSASPLQEVLTVLPDSVFGPAGSAVRWAFACTLLFYHVRRDAFVESALGLVRLYFAALRVPVTRRASNAPAETRSPSTTHPSVCNRTAMDDNNKDDSRNSKTIQRGGGSHGDGVNDSSGVDTDKDCVETDEDDFFPLGVVDLAVVVRELSSDTPLLMVIDGASESPEQRIESLARSSSTATATTTTTTAAATQASSSSSSSLALRSIAMGSAESAAAAETCVNEAMSTGGWVLLKNIHLARAFMSMLEKRLHRAASESSIPLHSRFRLFLTAERAGERQLPETLVSRSVVVVYESPPGMKAALLRSYGSETRPDEFVAPDGQSCPSITEATANDRSSDHSNDAAAAGGGGGGGGKNRSTSSRSRSRAAALERLFLVAAWVHAVVVERRDYAPVGWTSRYDFGETEYVRVMQTIRAWTDVTDADHSTTVRVSWKALRHIIATTIYGGYVSNVCDERVLDGLCARYFQPAILSAEDFILGEAHTVATSASPPPLPGNWVSREALMQWVDKLADGETSPAWVHLSARVARLTRVRQATEALHKWAIVQSSQDDALDNNYSRKEDECDSKDGNNDDEGNNHSLYMDDERTDGPNDTYCAGEAVASTLAKTNKRAARPMGGVGEFCDLWSRRLAETREALMRLELARRWMSSSGDEDDNDDVNKKVSEEAAQEALVSVAADTVVAAPSSDPSFVASPLGLVLQREVVAVVDLLDRVMADVSAVRAYIHGMTGKNDEGSNTRNQGRSNDHNVVHVGRLHAIMSAWSHDEVPPAWRAETGVCAASSLRVWMSLLQDRAVHLHHLTDYWNRAQERRAEANTLDGPQPHMSQAQGRTYWTAPWHGVEIRLGVLHAPMAWLSAGRQQAARAGSTRASLEQWVPRVVITPEADDTHASMTQGGAHRANRTKRAVLPREGEEDGRVTLTLTGVRLHFAVVGSDGVCALMPDGELTDALSSPVRLLWSWQVTSDTTASTTVECEHDDDEARAQAVSTEVDGLPRVVRLPTPLYSTDDREELLAMVPLPVRLATVTGEDGWYEHGVCLTAWSQEN